MMRLTSIGQLLNETAKLIYSLNGNLVDNLVKAGKISADFRNVEWAKRVSKQLVQCGLKVPKNIQKILN